MNYPGKKKILSLNVICSSKKKKKKSGKISGRKVSFTSHSLQEMNFSV